MHCTTRQASAHRDLATPLTTLQKTKEGGTGEFACPYRVGVTLSSVGIIAAEFTVSAG